MILVDTSLWVDHINRADPTLLGLLEAGEVISHPFVIGELMMGSPKNRQKTLTDLKRLPSALVAKDQEVLEFIEANSLFGVGVGYIDVHLLASVALNGGASLWTKDRRLYGAALRLGLAADIEPQLLQ